jgi:lysozyme family protein
MAEFEPCYEKVIRLEGGYNLHEVAGDRGGMTYAGIARNFWPKWAGWGKIDAGEYDAKLTSMVRAFYKKEYWDKMRGDQIVSQQIAYHIYAFSINAGRKAAVRLAQRVVGATPDGIFGPKTLARLNEMIEDEKDERIFIVTYSLLKIFRYKDICLNDDRRQFDKIESNEKFLCGWINRVQKGLQ